MLSSGCIKIHTTTHPMSGTELNGIRKFIEDWRPWDGGSLKHHTTMPLKFIGHVGSISIHIACSMLRYMMLWMPAFWDMSMMFMALMGLAFAV